MNARTLSGTLDRMLTLNRALDQVVAGTVARELAGGSDARLWVPAMDVAERADAYLVYMELPGVAPEQVEVGFEQHVLTVRGTKSASFDTRAEGELRVYASERVSGSFERAVRLPDSVDSERIDATFTNGVLIITIPKAQASRPRKIEVKVGSAPAQGAVEGGEKTA